MKQDRPHLNPTLPDIINKINTLKNDSKSLHSIFLSELHDLYNALILLEKHHQLIRDDYELIQELKLSLLIKLRSMLAPEHSSDNEKPVKHTKLKYVVSALITLSGTLLSGVAGYSLFHTFLALVCTVSNPVSLVFGLIFGVVESFLYVALDGISLLRSMGTNLVRSKKMLSIYKEEVKVVKHIQESITSTVDLSKFSQKQIKLLASIVATSHADITNKNENLVCQSTESKRYKYFKGALGVLDGALQFGGGLIAGKGLLAILGLATIASSPIGWALGTLVGLTMLGSFVCSRKKQIDNLNLVSSSTLISVMSSQNKLLHKKHCLSGFTLKLDQIYQSRRSLHERNKLMTKTLAKIKANAKAKAANRLYSIATFKSALICHKFFQPKPTLGLSCSYPSTDRGALKIDNSTLSDQNKIFFNLTTK